VSLVENPNKKEKKMISLQILSSSFGNNIKCSISVNNKKLPDEFPLICKVAWNLANLHRVPLLEEEEEKEEENHQQQYFCICQEEFAIFVFAQKQNVSNFIQITSATKENNNKDDDYDYLQPKYNHAKMCAFLFLATRIKTQNGKEIIPRCDAAGFGATFACYSVLEENNNNEKKNEHSFALVWTMILPSSNEEEEEKEEKEKRFSLPPHQECGYIRLAKSVRKAAWILWMTPKKKWKSENNCSSDEDFVEKMLGSFDFELRKLC
jgi:hypothetical protein